MAKISAGATIIIVINVAFAAPPPMKAPADDGNCFSHLADAGECLSFVEKGSRLHKPDHACCPELNNLTKTNPVCLCQLLFNSSQFGFSIDTNKAFKLPSLCNVSTPPVSSCAAQGQGPGNEDSGSPIALVPSKHNLLIGLLLLYISVNLN